MMTTETRVKVIDADAHVIETERTWDCLEPHEHQFRPTLYSSPDAPERQFWVVDGQIAGFRFPTLSEMQQTELSKRRGRLVTTPPEARELNDIELRLKHMDDLGIDVQVLHNTFWIGPVTDRPDIDTALTRAYNRWMGGVWKAGNDRLLWSCVLPYLSIVDSLEQMRYARDHGAVAVNIRPFEDERLISDPYFYPIYEQAARLDMAMIVHVGNGSADNLKFVRSTNDNGFTLSQFRVPVIIAAHTYLCSDLHARYPELRWGFIEASAQWAPWIVREAQTRRDDRLPDQVLKEWNVYITCQTDDDIPYIIRDQGEDFLVIGTDYGHFDPSSEIDAFEVLNQRFGDQISETAMRKIVFDNARRLYGLK
jgi:predicted TIM-barrel fold metal-dependent hydrolase